MGYILFGAGMYGKKAVYQLGMKNIDMFVDNNAADKMSEDGIPIYHFNDIQALIKGKRIVITVSEKYRHEIANQLEENGFEYIYYQDLLVEITRNKILDRQDCISLYRRAIQWINTHTIPGAGVIISTDQHVSYPEVTGYYIPTLLRWGYRNLAISYARWLLDIQKEDGSWYDAYDNDAYIFDSAQVLKGLLAIRSILPEVDKPIEKGCDWILSRMTENGRLITPSKNAWGDDTDFCDEIIHIYCLSPIIEAGEILQRPDYAKKAGLIWKFYRENFNEKIMNFSLLSHFYAYLMEALLDLGEIDLARKAMSNIEVYQKDSGAVPGLNNVDWVCSTGLFQLAMVWYRIGNRERGEKAFCYACKLQNESGGWYGSYTSENGKGTEPIYFPSSEISWCNKFFLDALYWRNKTCFENAMDDFWCLVDRTDGRYAVVENAVNLAIKSEKRDSNNVFVLDVGCGKGRYLRNLLDYSPQVRLYGVDLATKISLDLVNAGVDFIEGSLLSIPYSDNRFDVVYTVEALEHAIDIEAAVAEMARVTKSGGKLIVIDKDIETLGRLEIGEWEQWFDRDELSEIMLKYCDKVDVETNISYDGNIPDGLFCAWIGLIK